MWIGPDEAAGAKRGLMRLPMGREWMNEYPQWLPCDQSWRNDDRMGWRRWGVVYVAASVLIVVVALGFVGERLKFFEPVGWLAGIVSMVAAVIALFARTPAQAPQPIPTTGPPTPSTAVDRLGAGLMTVSAMPTDADSTAGQERSGRPPVNQNGPRKSLEDHLQAGGPRVIAVHGGPGVGKSKLVEYVLKELGQEAATFTLHEDHRLDVMTLVRAIDPSIRSAPRDDGDVLDQLQAVLEDAAGELVTVVVDGAQHLLEPDSGTMRDLRLEEALRKVTAGQRRVKVILVGSRLPEVGRGDQPPFTIVSIPVQRLSAADFRTYLEGVATARGVALGPIDWSLLYEALDGLPRLGQLFCSALALEEAQLTARGLARQLAKKIPSDRERALATEVVRALNDRQRRVAVALATFRTPVPARLLQDLLHDELPGSIQPHLTELADAQVIGTFDDLYYVLNGEVLATLDALPDGPAALLDKAVEVVARRSGAAEQAVSARDLDMSFAEIDLRCRAGEWLTAFGRIERLDPILRTMHVEDLLLKPRETVQPFLEGAAAKVRNRNAIGTIYLVRGDLEKARSAFTDGLREMTGSGLPVLYERRIRLNLADLFWRAGEFSAAQNAFQRVLNLIPAVAERDTEDRLDHIAALAGLADCERHWGAHDEAIRLNAQAWAEAAAEPSRQDVRIALRLARWYSEAGDREMAAGFLAEAEAVADRIAPGDLALRAQCLDGRADLALDAEDFRAAVTAAGKAVRTALGVNAPATVMQARTTLALAHLRLGDEDPAEIGAARKAIEEALPYRRGSRALVVLALRALIAFRQDPDGVAVTYFADLERQAVARQREKRDYAAWEFEGLARAAAHALAGRSIEPAARAFRNARVLSPVTEVSGRRLAYMLRLLAARMPVGSMERLVDAAIRPADKGERLQ